MSRDYTTALYELEINSKQSTGSLLGKHNNTRENFRKRVRSFEGWLFFPTALCLSRTSGYLTEAYLISKTRLLR